MRLLLEHGADPKIATEAGTTPLMVAAGVNWAVAETFDEGPIALLEAVQLTHELGNDVNAQNSMGVAAIHGAANRGANDVIEYLAANGARLDVADARDAHRSIGRRGCFSRRIRPCVNRKRSRSSSACSAPHCHRPHANRGLPT